MENQYIKQFPDLMKGKRIMYIHGFGSSAQSGTVKRIALTFPGAEVIAYDLPLHPEEAMTLLREKTHADNPDLIIGTSMGGMYAEMLRGYDRILVNPAFEMGETMASHGMTGRQTFQNPRQDGIQEFIVTKAMVKEYKEITGRCFQGITPEDRRRVFGLFGDRDLLVDTFDLFRSHYAQAARFHGEHRMTDESFLNGVVPVIRWIDDRQEHRERPIVYIGLDTLRDDYGKDRPSMRKTYRTLIERYEVYIVSPAPTNEPGRLTEASAWTEEYLSTPAWNHVVYTNQPQLLYGDYMISTAPDDGFMGTGIAFGSDEFKTWEEILTYFERLGGQ